MKLKDTLTSNGPQRSRIKRRSSDQEDAQPPGYMASLITKIVHNISIVCNNIVLKFIEEDIVLSMNVQHLSVHSADQRWRRSFIADVSPTNILFRKLINIIDFTICIDRRNSSGKIEHVAEPLLYKCSMEMRLYRKFDTTRIDVKIDSLNLNICTQHFSMLFRIYDLFIAFKTGKFVNKLANDESLMKFLYFFRPISSPICRECPKPSYKRELLSRRAGLLDPLGMEYDSSNLDRRRKC